VLRPIHRADMEQLIAIEKAVQIAPWSEHSFAMCMSAGYLGWVIEKEQTILGFIIASLHHTEYHILNLCINFPYQRQGFGQLLLNHALSHAQAAGAAFTYLEVRQSNSRAINLYQKLGFSAIGERKDYYPTVNGREDALILALVMPKLDQIIT
jgi:[ribosomal protein S18]-alanine N-acetyltransferase